MYYNKGTKEERLQAHLLGFMDSGIKQAWYTQRRIIICTEYAPDDVGCNWQVYDDDAEIGELGYIGCSFYSLTHALMMAVELLEIKENADD